MIRIMKESFDVYQLAEARHLMGLDASALLQFSVLLAVHGQGDPVPTLTEHAMALRVSTAAMNGALDSLEDKGLVERATGIRKTRKGRPSRRETGVFFTEEGRAKFEEAVRKARKTEVGA